MYAIIVKKYNDDMKHIYRRGGGVRFLKNSKPIETFSTSGLIATTKYTDYASLTENEKLIVSGVVKDEEIKK